MNHQHSALRHSLRLWHRLACAARAGATSKRCGAHDEAAGDGTGHEDQGEQNLVARLVVKIMALGTTRNQLIKLYSW